MGNGSSRDDTVKALAGAGTAAAFGITTFLCPPLGATPTHTTLAAGGKPYFPTPDPRDTVFFAKNAKTIARGLF